jgi:hypothetical protein
LIQKRAAYAFHFRPPFTRRDDRARPALIERISPAGLRFLGRLRGGCVPRCIPFSWRLGPNFTESVKLLARDKYDLYKDFHEQIERSKQQAASSKQAPLNAPTL